MENNNLQSLERFYIPGAIVLAGVIIAGAVLFNSSRNGTTAALPEAVIDPKEVMEPVSPKDHVLGDPYAPVVIVEYSDLECPFCKDFHETMKLVMKEYGDERKVAWIFRHAPLTQLHAKALPEAKAAECAAELGGTVKFWEYVDRVFTVTPSNDGLDLATLPDLAEDVDLPRKDFEKCLKEADYNEKIQGQLQDGLETAQAFGLNFGTPFSVFIESDGRARSISGAQSFESLKFMIDEALAKDAEE
ncbi:MAG: thioredoxin domain-containing protein [Parcubacteria group bacterium]|nr:thioredoxin domain-containing protein [Parcubacteria group bacterium]